MYTQDVNKQQTIVAGVIGSLICEIESGDYKSIQAFHKEMEDIYSIRGQIVINTITLLLLLIVIVNMKCCQIGMLSN